MSTPTSPQRSASMPPLHDGVFRGQDLTADRYPCSEGSHPFRDYTLAHGCCTSTNTNVEETSSLEGASEQAVRPALQCLQDSDKRLSSKRSVCKFINTTEYSDLLLGYFTEDKVNYPVRSARGINPAFEKKLDNIEASIIAHEGLFIGDKYILDDDAIHFTQSKVR